MKKIYLSDEKTRKVMLFIPAGIFALLKMITVILLIFSDIEPNHLKWVSFPILFFGLLLGVNVFIITYYDYKRFKEK